MELAVSVQEPVTREERPPAQHYVSISRRDFYASAHWRELRKRREFIREKPERVGR